MAYGEEWQQTRPARRWGRRLLIVLIVLLIVFGVLLAVADRVAEGVAEQRITEEVDQQLAARGVQSSRPEVSVGGFPFLTQVLGEKYDSITILLRDVSTAPDQRGDTPAGIKLSRVDVEARDVNAPIDTLRTGQGDIVATTVEGTATVGYPSVVKLINQPDLRLLERDGKLLATLPVRLFGQQFTLTGEAAITATDGGIRLKFQELTADGLPDTDAARSAVNTYAKDLSVDVPLPALPFGIKVRDVQPLPDGLAVTATAADVSLNQAAG